MVDLPGFVDCWYLEFLSTYKYKQLTIKTYLELLIVCMFVRLGFWVTLRLQDYFALVDIYLKQKIQGLNFTTFSWQFFVTFSGWLSAPFKWLSDLQLGDEKVTKNHHVLWCFNEKNKPFRAHLEDHPRTWIGG